MKESYRLRGWPADPHPHVGLTGGVFIGFFQGQHAGFVTVQYRIGQHDLFQQVERRLDQFTRLDHPAGRGVAGNLDTGKIQYRLLAMQWQCILVFGGRYVGQ